MSPWRKEKKKPSRMTDNVVNDEVQTRQAGSRGRTRKGAQKRRLGILLDSVFKHLNARVLRIATAN